MRRKYIKKKVSIIKKIKRSFIKSKTFKKLCRFLLGWVVIPIIAGKNDRLAAVFIGYAMMGWKITPHMKKRKVKLWRWCQWWGIA